MAQPNQSFLAPPSGALPTVLRTAGTLGASALCSQKVAAFLLILRSVFPRQPTLATRGRPRGLAIFAGSSAAVWGVGDDGDGAGFPARRRELGGR